MTTILERRAPGWRETPRTFAPVRHGAPPGLRAVLAAGTLTPAPKVTEARCPLCTTRVVVIDRCEPDPPIRCARCVAAGRCL